MKNPITQLLKTVGAAITPAPLKVDIPVQWLEPVSAEMPCGPSLEYDPELAVLAARLAPKTEVQYGQFTVSPPEPDWKEVERDCRRLLLRSKDLNLLLWFTRSRARQAGASGLLQGLSSLQQVCERFGDAVHPQLHIDGEFDPMVRANTLATLCDPEGLLADVRDIVIVSGTAQRLTVRDVERALAVPRSPYACEPDTVHRQLADLYQRQDAQLLALQACAACVQYLQTWAEESMADDASDLRPLMALLMPLLGTSSASLPVAVQRVAAEPVEEAAQGGERGLPSQQAPMSMPLSALQPEAVSPLHSREQVRDALAQVRGWIEHHEPSSPVAVLLKQAERMWGRRFSEIAHMIPPELLKAWDQED